MQLRCRGCGRAAPEAAGGAGTQGAVAPGEPAAVCPACGAPWEVDLEATASFHPLPGSDAPRHQPEARAAGKPERTALAATATENPPAVREAAERLSVVGSVPAAQVPGIELKRVGNYTLLRRLGGGGMGTVYEAEEAVTLRRVALKLIAPGVADCGEAVERFRQEGRLASAIAHPRCVFVYGADEDAGQPYIVMELMPGETLKDLVERQGPLEPAEAVAKILDVIEGLQEAHRMAVIHRDVKPSNCFLDSTGRVKIGDFGLSKSLVHDAHLTQSGRFLGTLLFASPEQVRGEAVDERTDVYSVAATLYYLLTGRAPFEGHDAAATLARIVSDPPPPLRSLRPALPRALETAVLRGLERQPQRRWRDLEELRQALLPLAAGRLSAARPGLRAGAYLADAALFAPLAVVADQALAEQMLGIPASTGLGLALRHLALLLPWLVYFTVLEGLWGASLGKRLLRLRVVTASGCDRPGLLRAGVRVAALYAITTLPADIIDLFYVHPEDLTAWDFYYVLAAVVGWLAIPSTMRARNGYRGPHELVSGTRVIRMPPARKRRWEIREAAADRRVEVGGLPARVGAFSVLRALRWDAQAKTLLGEDRLLGRKALVTLRPGAAEPLSPVRQNLARPARLRWLAGGVWQEYRWDAFVAPRGAPLTDVVGTGLAWRDARHLLEQLADELSRALDDGTLPESLSLEHVWVEPSGSVKLLDGPWLSPQAPQPPLGLAPEARALALLREVTRLALEGRPGHWETAPQPGRNAPPEQSPASDGGTPPDRTAGDVARGRESGPTAHGAKPLGAARRAAWWLVAIVPAVLLVVLGVKAAVGVDLLPLELTATSRRFLLLALWLGLALWRLRDDAVLRRAIERARRPVLAPLPEHASHMLSRLMHSENPYAHPRQFFDELEATRDRPTEVDAAMRTVHLAVLATLLLPGLMAMFAFGLGFNGYSLWWLADEVERTGKALHVMQLDPEARRAYVESHLAAGETIYAGGPIEAGGQVFWGIGRDEAQTIFSDASLQEQLRDKHQRDRRQLELRLRALNSFDRWVWHDEYLQAKRLFDRPSELDFDEFTVQDAVDITWETVWLPNTQWLMLVGVVASVLVFPVCWILWPLLAREGFAYRIVGISLVRRDGRRAARWQCAWRALLVWGPLVALLTLGPLLQVLRPEMASLSVWMGWLALAVGAGYLLLTLGWPARSLHDRLAGTWLVPR